MTVVLPGGPTLIGRVAGQGGDPQGGASCSLWELRPNDRPVQVRSTMTNAEGEFAFTVESGTTGFVLVSGTPGRTCTPPFDIGVATDLGTLFLEDLETLTGSVRFPDGHPGSGLHVKFGAPIVTKTGDLREDGSFLSGRTWGSTITDDQGRFEFRGLRAGEYIVFVNGGTLPNLLYVEEEEREVGPDGILSKLPPGKFSVLIYPELNPRNDEFMFLESDEASVVLSDESTPEVQFQMQSGGHLELALSVAQWPDGSDPADPSDQPGKQSWHANPGVRVELGSRLEDGTGSTLTEFQRLDAFDNEAIWSPRPVWTPLTTARNWAVLKPGRYPYRISGAAWAPVEGTIEILGGRTARLDIELSPR